MRCGLEKGFVKRFSCQCGRDVALSRAGGPKHDVFGGKPAMIGRLFALALGCVLTGFAVVSAAAQGPAVQEPPGVKRAVLAG